MSQKIPSLQLVNFPQWGNVKDGIYNPLSYRGQDGSPVWKRASPRDGANAVEHNDMYIYKKYSKKDYQNYWWINDDNSYPAEGYAKLKYDDKFQFPTYANQFQFPTYANTSWEISRRIDRFGGIFGSGKPYWDPVEEARVIEVVKPSNENDNFANQVKQKNIRSTSAGNKNKPESRKETTVTDHDFQEEDRVAVLAHLNGDHKPNVLDQLQELKTKNINNYHLGQQVSYIDGEPIRGYDGKPIRGYINKITSSNASEKTGPGTVCVGTLTPGFRQTGTVQTLIGKDRICVKYDDDDDDDDDDDKSINVFDCTKDKIPLVIKIPKYEKNDRVLVYWKNEKWYSGLVNKVNTDGTLNITLDDPEYVILTGESYVDDSVDPTAIPVMRKHEFDHSQMHSSVPTMAASSIDNIQQKLQQMQEMQRSRKRRSKIRSFGESDIPITAKYFDFSQHNINNTSVIQWLKTVVDIGPANKVEIYAENCPDVENLKENIHSQFPEGHYNSPIRVIEGSGWEL